MHLGLLSCLSFYSGIAPSTTEATMDYKRIIRNIVTGTLALLGVTFIADLGSDYRIAAYYCPSPILAKLFPNHCGTEFSADPGQYYDYPNYDVGFDYSWDKANGAK